MALFFVTAISCLPQIKRVGTSIVLKGFSGLSQKNHDTNLMP